MLVSPNHSISTLRENDNDDAESENVSTSLLWSYMKDFVAPIAGTMEHAAQTLTESAKHIPTVSFQEFHQAMQTKSQLLQVGPRWLFIIIEL